MESVSLTCWGLIGNGEKWSCTILTILPWTWSFLGERMIRRMTWDLLGGPTIWAQRPDKHPSWEKSKQLGPKPRVLRHWWMDVVDDLQLFFRLIWIWISPVREYLAIFKVQKAIFLGVCKSLDRWLCIGPL